MKKWELTQGESIIFIDNNGMKFCFSPSTIVDILNKYEEELLFTAQALKHKEEDHELLIEDFRRETDKLREQIKVESEARQRAVEAYRKLDEDRREIWLDYKFFKNRVLSLEREIQNGSLIPDMIWERLKTRINDINFNKTPQTMKQAIKWSVCYEIDQFKKELKSCNT